MPEMNTHYGIYGGQYVAETLMGALQELEREYFAAQKDPAFQEELQDLLKNYVGRESPLYHAKRLSRHCGGAQIYLKREDLNHTGAHKVNNTLGQALLARRMGKRRLIAETGAGMHGVATATVAALFGMECEVFMGAVDVARQAPNVERMHALGAKVRSITEGSQTLKDAMNAALREWTATSQDTFYLIGTAAGPYPYPMLVKQFQSVIGKEARRQCLEQCGRLPDEVVACVGGGSNAIGIFAGFEDDPQVKLVGAEAGGLGLSTGMHAASINGGKVGILHGMKAYFLQDDKGQIRDTHSVSAGLDYTGVGPEHCYLADSGRAHYAVIEDQEAIDAFDALCRLEGIIPALESAHAVAQGMKDAAAMAPSQIVVVNLSGRGDKDMDNIRNYKEKHGQNR
ncbi:MAG: tryptophan synthase subunit beta [Oligosphaeraceae bacterium]